MIESRKDFLPIVYLQWKDDDGELVGDVMWCVDRIHEDDIVYQMCSEDEPIELEGGSDDR